MTDLTSYYPIHTPDDIQGFLDTYIPLVLAEAERFGLNLAASAIKGDHFGLQAISAEEFDKCHIALLKIANTVHSGTIHKRRNSIYQFKKIPSSHGITMPRIEIFEPKPGEESKELRAGIEHLAFVVQDYDQFLVAFQQNGHPVAKAVEHDTGSKFFKTALLNSIEIEFRNDSLGDRI